LTLDGYDLSGYINSNAEYDKLVVQILAKAVTSGTIDSGLRILSASGCGLSAISDVLDLTPIASGDSTTDQFKLTSLDLSNNSISDVSVLITESIFPNNFLTTLDISDNNICDIEGMVDELETYFSTGISITYSDQTCHCSASVSSSDHQVCREVYPDRWAVECWNGYYLDKASGECLEVCAGGSEIDTSSGSPPYPCITAASDVDDSIRVQVCERHTNMMAVLEVGDSSITCGCRSAWYGEDCSSECPIVGGEVCSGHGSCNTTDHACECDTWYDDASCSTLVPIYSPECDRTFTIDDHLECNEVYPGRYAAECEDGYYYDQGEYSCVYDTNTDCPNDMNDNQMCVKTADGDVITSDCRSAWYGDDCDQLYSVHIPDTLFRGKVCDAICNSDPLCDVTELEGDIDYLDFIAAIFPIHNTITTTANSFFLPNSCPLNIDPGNSPYNCNTSNASCPSIVLNEVFNSVDGVNEKQCAFIAKEGSSGECYTVHDDSIRQYLKDHCLPTSNVESNGVISVATMRSVLSCPLDANSNESLSLPDIASAASLSSVNSITTLQGLEYATSLTSLTLDGYDLSGDINSNAEYDKLVVQILAKAVTYSNDYGTIDSGLRILSASGCGLSAISDVLDLTPIASGDSTTDQFKLTSLDLSNNSISDVSVLITESIFPNNFLTTLDISDNNICDIDAVV
ncbi:Acidic leucine-rich nuclear phosphoprotein 32 like protein, partial [Aduncisulcus paluster]